MTNCIHEMMTKSLNKGRGWGFSKKNMTSIIDSPQISALTTPAKYIYYRPGYFGSDNRGLGLGLFRVIFQTIVKVTKYIGRRPFQNK